MRTPVVGRGSTQGRYTQTGSGSSKARRVVHQPSSLSSATCPIPESLLDADGQEIDERFIEAN